MDILLAGMNVSSVHSMEVSCGYMVIVTVQIHRHEPHSELATNVAANGCVAQRRTHFMIRMAAIYSNRHITQRLISEHMMFGRQFDF